MDVLAALEAVDPKDSVSLVSTRTTFGTCTPRSTTATTIHKIIWSHHSLHSAVPAGASVSGNVIYICFAMKHPISYMTVGSHQFSM